MSETAGFALMLTSDTLGRGDDELGARLTGSFLDVLGGPGRTPEVIALLNSGVKLAVEGSPVLNHLTALEQAGSRILACGTCLNHFELTEKLAVGQKSTMPEIVDSMLAASKVVTL